MTVDKKTKERTGYFYEKEEQAVADYSEYGRIISGATIDILKLELDCTDKDIENLRSGKTLYEIIEMAETVPVKDDAKQLRISELNQVISNARTERERVFNETLKPALTKMIESIIRGYKLYVPDEEFQQTFSDTISYLTTKMDGYKQEKGTKAYSYCGTICKNYLLWKNMAFKKEQQRSVQYDDMLSDFAGSNSYYEEPDEFRSIADKLIAGISTEIKNMIADPEKHMLNDNEIKVGIALTDLLDNWQEVLKYDDESNKLQKSSVLYFLREETMMSTKEIRDNMKKYKSAYNILKRAALE